LVAPFEEPYMKMVVAVIGPERLCCVKNALKTTKTVQVTVRRRRAHPDTRFHLSPKLRVEIYTEDLNAEEVVAAIRPAVYPKEDMSSNESRFFVVPLEQCRDQEEWTDNTPPARAG
jgi:nitrogen regulatory protein PII